MKRTLLALACAVALGLCGCTINGVSVDAGAEPIPDYLIEKMPVEVEMDGISFRVPKGCGWDDPDYIDRDKNQSVWVYFQPPGQDPNKGNWGTVNLIKCHVNPARFDVADLGTDLEDTDYINAGMDYFDGLADQNTEHVYDESDWKVRRDPGGVACSCHYSDYPDPRLTHSKGYVRTGECAFIFTDHGSYVFDAFYDVVDFGNDDPEDALEVLQVADTLRVNPSN